MGQIKEQIFLKAIDQQKKDDPLIGLKIGAKELVSRLISALEKKEGKVHIESLLAIVGSLGGYSCHAAIREAFVDTGKLVENQAFTVITTKNGSKYYFGDLVNQYLAGSELCFWTLVGGEAQELGATSFPDLNEIFKRTASTVGSDKFGVVLITKQHLPPERPIVYVRSLWVKACKIVDKFCDSPTQRPILFALAAQQVMSMGKDIISPEIAVSLLIECAVPMSKIGPEWLEDKK